ncbi:MAG: hypothetical protein AMJ77_01895 [Dehalococcoidia bacterium SM23_28_2]|nr:MAG: hypothetical protein AMJ77_01895 [Dehalococcoidia bacterium SM23_28_2]
MNRKAEELCRAIDDLLPPHPCKTLVVEPEAQELLRVAHLRREVGRMIAAMGVSRQEQTWQRLEATLRVR